MYSGFIEILASRPVVISNFPYWRFACSPIAGATSSGRGAVSWDGGIAAAYFRYRMMKCITLKEKHSDVTAIVTCMTDAAAISK